MPIYERIVNEGKKEASIRLYGQIGAEIDGNAVAHDLGDLGERMDTVFLYLNSPGGSVDGGFSIISAILHARAYIHVYVDGIAASMAAVIAVAADKVSMQDYAKLMIHDPFYSGRSTAKLSQKEVKALDSIKDSLRTVLSRRGCDKDKIASLMEEETWFSAEEAKAAGLIDEVISTPRKEEFKSLTITELMDRLINEYKPKKSFNMNEIAKALGLPEDVTEAQIIAAIKEKNNSLAEMQNSLVDHYLTLGVKNGVVTEKNKEKMQRLAKADFSLFAEMMEAIEKEEEGKTEEETLTRKSPYPSPGRLSAALEEMKGAAGSGNGKTAGKKTYDWYQKHDPRALAALEKENPKEFNRLLDEYESNIE